MSVFGALKAKVHNRLSSATHVTGRQLEPLLDEAERAGIRVKEILHSLGYKALAHKAMRIDAELTLIDYFRIEGEVARRLDDLTAHLSERKLTYDTGAFVTTQMRGSTTLSEALYNLAQYFNMMHGEHYNSIRTTDRTVSLIIDDRAFPYTMRDDLEMVHFVGDCVLIKVQCILDSLSNGLAESALRRIAVKRHQIPHLSSHLEFWTKPVSFGQPSYELCFDREQALAPMRTPDTVDLSSEGVFSRVISYLEQRQPFDGQTTFESKVLELIRDGIFQQDAVAQRLSISVATLRRRLEDEGTNFRNLTQTHLLNEATQLLRKGYSVSHVGELLNYSDVRAFNRAFKRWKGETPAQYARREAALTEDA